MHFLLQLSAVVTLDLEARSIVYLVLLYPVLISILAVFVATSSVFFLFLQRRWSHGDTQQQKEKSMILPPFWAARSAVLFALAESSFWEKVVIS